MEDIKYKVVWELGYDRLQNKVNELISEGWLPIGGICVFPHTAKDMYEKDELRLGCAQAMVRKD